METKVFEIRDRATHIGAIATKMVATQNAEKYELARCGYHNSNMVMLATIDNEECHYDPYGWGTWSRTLFEAHKYIRDHFDELTSGQVVDVEYILGEVDKPCQSDQYYVPEG